MRHFISRRDPQALFYFMSSIFFVALSAILVKSDTVSYNVYYFSTNEGSVYRLFLISNVNEWSYFNCTITNLIKPFRDALIKEMNGDFCSAQLSASSSALFNYTLVDDFVGFEVNRVSVNCANNVDQTFNYDSFTGEYGFLSKLFLYNASKDDLAFEACVKKK